MDTAADIIKTALDILTTDAREVELGILMYGMPVTRYGKLTGLGTMGGHGTVTVENYRYPDGQVITERTLVGLDEIIYLNRA